MPTVTLPEMAERYLYDLEAGVIVETDKPLDAEQLEKARADYLARPSKRRHEAVAQGLGGVTWQPENQPTVRVGVDQAELERLLERAYPDPAERAKIEGALRG